MPKKTGKKILSPTNSSPRINSRGSTASPKAEGSATTSSKKTKKFTKPLTRKASAVAVTSSVTKLKERKDKLRLPKVKEEEPEEEEELHSLQYLALSAPRTVPLHHHKAALLRSPGKALKDKTDWEKADKEEEEAMAASQHSVQRHDLDSTGKYQQQQQQQSEPTSPGLKKEDGGRPDHVMVPMHTMTSFDGEGSSAEDQSPTSQPESPKMSKEATEQSQRVLILLVVLKMMTSFDSGAFSVVLGEDDGLSEDLNLSTSQGGVLSGAVFLGNLCGCLVAGNMFAMYPAKKVFLQGMIAHAVFTLLFGWSTSYEYAIVLRFFIGITLAFPVIYSPIWVESFGPSDRQTTWIALINAGVPVGIMLGFVLGGLIPADTDLDWRWIFYLKALAMVPVLLILNSMDSKYIDVELMVGDGGATANKDDNSGGGSNQTEGQDHRQGPGPTPATGGAAGQPMSISTVFTLLKKFSQNPLYSCNVATLCSLYFVITALQTFVTPYLRQPPFNADMNTIVIGFGATVVTAPVFGVIGGGMIIDKLGGYHKHTGKAMRVCTVWGISSFVLAVITLSCTTLSSFLFSMWCLLAVGGAMVPVATGVLIACVPEEERAAASSVSAMCFNFFGYFCGPLFCGMVADYTNSLAWGIRITLLCSAFGIFPSAYAAKVAKNVTLSHTTHNTVASEEGSPYSEDSSGGSNDGSSGNEGSGSGGEAPPMGSSNSTGECPSVASTEEGDEDDRRSSATAEGQEPKETRHEA